MQISLGQMNLQLGQPAHNLEQVASWVAEAARQGSQLVVFPELWSTAYDLENWPDYADPLGEGMFAEVSNLAKTHGIAIAGSLLEQRNGTAFNTLTLHDANGQLVTAYRKVHLVPMLDEPKWLAPGQELQLAEASWGKTGLGICYDLRFPEMWRKYALNGAQLFIIPAEWPSRRTYHWQTLLRARAIENQVFVVACNRVGESRGEVFAGRSAVIDPWGEVAIEGDCENSALLTVEIHLDRVEEIRNQVPVFQDRRSDLYSL